MHRQYSGVSADIKCIKFFFRNNPMTASWLTVSSNEDRLSFVLRHAADKSLLGSPPTLLFDACGKINVVSRCKSRDRKAMESQFGP